MLGEPSGWDAGSRLIRADDTQAWSAIVQAVRMAQANRQIVPGCIKKANAAGKPAGALSASFRILIDSNLNFTNRRHYLKGGKIKRPAWAVSALGPKFVGLSIDVTDKIIEC